MRTRKENDQRMAALHAKMNRARRQMVVSTEQMERATDLMAHATHLQRQTGVNMGLVPRLTPATGRDAQPAGT
jgi:hypothetical protein